MSERDAEGREIALIAVANAAIESVPQRPAPALGSNRHLARAIAAVAAFTAVAVTIAVIALIVAVTALGARVDRRADAESEARRLALCELIDVQRIHSGDPPRTTAAGRVAAERAERAFKAYDCE